MYKQIVGLLIIVLMLVACGGESEMQADSAETAVETPTEVVATPEPQVAFAETFKNETGGFSAGVPEGFTVTLDETSAEIVSADESAEAFFNILGSAYTEEDEVTFDTVLEEFSGFLGDLNETTPIVIDGIEGIQADFAVDEEEFSIEGRIAVILTDTQGLIILSGADSWEDRDMETTFTAITESIEIFEPVVSAE